MTDRSSPGRDVEPVGDFDLEYAPAPESTAPVQLASQYGLYVGGEMVEPAAGALAPTINPATGERWPR